MTIPRLYVYLIIMSTLVLGQTNDLQTADSLARSQQFEQALNMYETILRGQAPALDAFKGRAYVLAWMGRYEEAIDAFRDILKKNPDHREILNGLAYSYAWSGKYRKAERVFNRVIQLDPDYKDALKGLAFVALWQSDPETARERFDSIREKYNRDAEVYLGLGQAYILENNLSSARSAFKQAYLLNSNYSDIPTILNGIQKEQAPLEAVLWIGSSTTESVNTQGIRQLDINWRLTHMWRLQARYDNSLSLENRFLFNSKAPAALYQLSAFIQPVGSYLAQFSAGIRNIPGQGRQWVYQSEHHWFIQSAPDIHAGGLWNRSVHGNNTWMVFVGATWSMSRQLRVEPFFFYSRETETKKIDKRYLLSASYDISDLNSVNMGLVLGSFNRVGGHLMWTLPLGSQHWITLLIRHEKADRETLNHIALGFRLRLE